LFVAVVAPPAATSVDVECLKSVPLITASWTAAAAGGSGVAWRGVAWRGKPAPQSGGDGGGGGAGDSARYGPAVALTIEVFLAATGTAAAPAFWASTAVAVRYALFVAPC